MKWKKNPPIAVKYWPIYWFIWLAPCGRRTCAILKELVKSYSDIRGINDWNRDVYSFCPRYWKHLQNIILSHGHPISFLFTLSMKGKLNLIIRTKKVVQYTVLVSQMGKWYIYNKGILLISRETVGTYCQWKLDFC